MKSDQFKFKEYKIIYFLNLCANYQNDTYYETEGVLEIKKYKIQI